MLEHRPNHHWLGQWGGGEYAVHYLAGAINGLAKVWLKRSWLCKLQEKGAIHLDAWQ